MSTSCGCQVRCTDQCVRCVSDRVSLFLRAGRYDRPQEAPLLKADENILGVCTVSPFSVSLCCPSLTRLARRGQALRDLELLDGLPVAFLGYSYGSALAYGCARLLQREWGLPVAHFVCLAGPSRAKYSAWQFMDPADRSLDSFVANMSANLGRANPQFDRSLQYLPLIFNLFFDVFHRGARPCLSTCLSACLLVICLARYQTWAWRSPGCAASTRWPRSSGCCAAT